MKQVIFTLLLFIVIGIGHLHGQSLNGAESAEYDAVGNRWFVSTGDIVVIESNGTLSFFGNATGSYGLEILGNTLFAVGSGVVKGYDLTTADEVMSVSIPGAGFLNGLTNDGVDKLYVTDFGNDRIHEIDVADLSNVTSSVAVSNTLTTPNGIVYDATNDRLLYTSWAGSNAKIRAVDRSDFSVSEVVTTNVGAIDGIDDDSDGNYYISSWAPARITKYSADFTNPETISTPFISNPADIGYAMETDTLAIPIGSNVVFVGFDQTPSSTNQLSSQDFQLSVYPNPSQGQSVIEFYLDRSEEITLELVDQLGINHYTVLSGKQIKGKNLVSLAGHDFPAGQYYVVLSTKAGRETTSMFLN